MREMDFHVADGFFKSFLANSHGIKSRDEKRRDRYQKRGSKPFDKGRDLITAEQGLEHLFVLTTQSVHWFTERGFNECDLSALPQEKQEFYNYQRNSRALVRQID